MEYVDIGHYIFATPIALFDVFGGSFVVLTAFLGLVGLWLCRSLFSSMRKER